MRIWCTSVGSGVGWTEMTRWRGLHFVSPARIHRERSWAASTARDGRKQHRRRHDDQHVAHVLHHTLTGPLRAGGRGSGAARRPGAATARRSGRPAHRLDGSASGVAGLKARGEQVERARVERTQAKSSSSVSRVFPGKLVQWVVVPSQIGVVGHDPCVYASGSLARILTHSAQKGNFAGPLTSPPARAGERSRRSVSPHALRAGLAFTATALRLIPADV